MQDGIQRINICFPKADTTSLKQLDEIRGNQSRSQALYHLITYAFTWNQATLKDIIKHKYDPEPNNANNV